MHVHGRIAAWWLTALLAVAGAAQAQDTRTVTEPVFPPVCSTLQAQLSITAGEPSSETAFDTSRIQSALNACTSGHALELKTNGSNAAFLIQPLNIPNGVTLLIDGGVTVFASRNPADYQITGKETCGTIGTKGGGCNPLIKVNNGNASTGSGLMGYGVIHGRGNETLLVSGTSTGQNWWDVTTSSSTSRTQNKPVILNAGSAANFTLYKITFLNSPYFSVQWSGDGFTAWGVKIIAPGTAPNTDGLDPSGSNMTITNASLSGGDDNIAVKAGNASSNITVTNINTYSGHGISVGSQTEGGLNHMLVQNINQLGDGPLAGGIGLRLKSDSDAGGLVQNVTYKNVCTDNVNYPVVLNPNYDSRTGTDIPTFSNILFQNIHVIGTKGKFQFDGYDVNHLSTVTLDNFVVDSLPQNYITPAMSYVTITLGPGPVVPALLQTQTGTSVSYNGSVTNPTQTPYACTLAGIPLMTGELYLSTAGATNLNTLSASAPGAFTLNAVVQPAQSQLTYVSYKPTTYTGVPAPTAAVNFMEGATVVGTGTLGGNGTIASAALTGVTAGTHTYTAVYPGDLFYPAYTFGSVTVTLTNAPTTVVTATPSTVYNGGSVTLKATVSSSGSTPTGTVTFYNGTASLGSSALISGIATLAITPTVLGSESITGVYAPSNAGDPGSTSSPITLNVVSPFAMSVVATSISLAPGHSGTSTITLTPAGGFNGTVSSSCVTSAAYVTCTIAPTSVTVSGTTNMTATFAVAAAVSALHTAHEVRGWYAVLLPLGILALGGMNRRRSVRRLFAIILLLGAGIATLSGCGSGGATASTGGGGGSPHPPPAGTQSATITTSVTNTAGTFTQTAQVTVNVTN